MSNWVHLRNFIKWPREVLYVVENEGKENKYGISFVMKFNGNIKKKNLKERLKEVNKLADFTEDKCKELEFEIAEQEEIEMEEDEDIRNTHLQNLLNYTHYRNQDGFNISEANNVLLRLHDKKIYLREQLKTTHFIDPKYDILIKEPPNFIFRLDNPLLNINHDPLLGLLRRHHDSTDTRKMTNNKKKSGKITKQNQVQEFKSYLYNIKIIESEETIIDDKTFIFSQEGSSELKIKFLIQEGKYIQRNLLQYKLDCSEMIDEEQDLENEINNSASEKNDKRGNADGEKDSVHEKSRKKKKTYEELGILPYSDIMILKKKCFKKEIDVAGFVTPFMLNGNIQKMIENIDHYLKYKYDNKLILENLCNIIRVMSYLEKKKIIHGNIKPSNIFISNDGFHMLIGNFIPTQKLQTYYFHVINKQRNFPKYISPELFFYLKKKKKNRNQKKKKVTHLQKYLVQNDIFCLGLSFYYILTMTDDILACIDMEEVFRKKLQTLNQYITIPKLHKILKRMLSYAPKERMTWQQILDVINETTESFQWNNLFPFDKLTTYGT